MENVPLASHKEEESKIDSGWEKSRKNFFIERLKAGNSLQSIMESFAEFKEVFRELLAISCSDGRVLWGRKIGIAGSALLLPIEELTKFINEFKGKIKTVTTHADCGAAAIKFKSLRPEEIPAGVTTADEYGTYMGKLLAEALGAEHVFIERDEMANEYHNEVGLVIDQTGEFDPTVIGESFPAHFLCTGAGLGFSKEYMKTEVNTLTKIAMGGHGFGERFTESNPFCIMVAANNKEELEKWKKVAEESTSEFGRRIRIDGFIRNDK